MGAHPPLSSRQAEEVQQQIIRDTFHLVLKRDDHICNFLECGRYRPPRGRAGLAPPAVELPGVPPEPLSCAPVPPTACSAARITS